MFHIEALLKSIHESEECDFYQAQTIRRKVFQITKEKSVIVLGSYSEPKVNEILQIRNYLRTKG